MFWFILVEVSVLLWTQLLPNSTAIFACVVWSVYIVPIWEINQKYVHIYKHLNTLCLVSNSIFKLVNIHQIIIRTYIWSKFILCLGCFAVKSMHTLLIVPRWDNKRFRTQASKNPGAWERCFQINLRVAEKKLRRGKKKRTNKKKRKKLEEQLQNKKLSSKNMRWDGYLWEKFKPSLMVGFLLLFFCWFFFFFRFFFSASIGWEIWENFYEKQT